MKEIIIVVKGYFMMQIHVY